MTAMGVHQGPALVRPQEREPMEFGPLEIRPDEAAGGRRRARRGRATPANRRRGGRWLVFGVRGPVRPRRHFLLAIVLDDADNPKLGEDFTCSGLIPGFGVSCAGKAGIWSRVNGHISLTSDPCKGPRPRFGFTVADGKGVTAGPFRLMSAKAGPAGRPLTGCPATATRKKTARRTARH